MRLYLIYFICILIIDTLTTKLNVLERDFLSTIMKKKTKDFGYSGKDSQSWPEQVKTSKII